MNRALMIFVMWGLCVGSAAAQQRVSDPQAQPWFTLPDLSILADAVAITSLVGRIYLDDEIVNPRLFKVIVGRDNLTANFHELPIEIEGMIFEGYATGDFTTRCVYGDLIAATFIFEDGSVSSFYPGDPGSRPKRNGEQSRIGYVSDPYGNPCITGRLITDAPAYLGSSFLLAGAGAYAQAFRDAQQTIIDRRDSSGQLTNRERVVSGDVNEYAAASALSGATQQSIEWLNQRFQHSTDVIYAPAGQRVDVHLQQELRLDKKPNQRKVRYTRVARQQRYLD